MDRKLFAYGGTVALGTLLGTMAIAAGLHLRGIVNAWALPLKAIAAFLGGGGLACFLVAFLLPSPWKRLLTLGTVAIVILNAAAYYGAYLSTSYRLPGEFGLRTPKPVNSQTPGDLGLAYATHRIELNRHEWLEAWSVPAGSESESRGTVLLFHGKGGSKGGSLLSSARTFHELGYAALLVDFRGVGGSSGNEITIGVREAKDVARSLSFARQENFPRPFVLYGISMGTAAILRAIAYEEVAPDAIVLELPFARLLDATRRRLPPIPLLAGLMVFWGGAQHGFNGFAHNPVVYARKTTCPVLILHGVQDKWTNVDEVEAMLENLGSAAKQLVLFPDAGHQLLATVDRDLWQTSVEQFLAAHLGQLARR